ncbi:MAG: hypothetical protein JWQ09_4403 [Segetibacter sp.]|nr:hypothetical protein [Segetibacter sp.]
MTTSESIAFVAALIITLIIGGANKICTTKNERIVFLTDQIVQLKADTASLGRHNKVLLDSIRKQFK